MAHFMHSLIASLSNPEYASRPIFKALNQVEGDHPTWTTVTYAAYLSDVERAAARWIRVLGEKEIAAPSVVGLWVTGARYSDLVNLYSLARAGYIPQVFSLRMTVQGRPIVFDMLASTGGKALIFDPTLVEYSADSPFPTFEIPELSTLSPVPEPLPELPDVAPTDIGIIFHTSGTTSGRPKPIPETHRWIKSQGQAQWPRVWSADFKTPAVINNLGSFANLGSAINMSCCSSNGQCMIQASKPDFEASEFLAMVKEGLNAVMLYGPWLSKLVVVARKDPAVYDALKAVTQITYTGASLNPDDEGWMKEHDIPISSFYATTETAICLVSDPPHMKTTPLLRLLQVTPTKLIPADGVRPDDLDSESERKFKGGILYELFVPDNADNCPHTSVRNRPDGHVTGDLFEEVQEGYYAYRGRNDDWIRTNQMTFCDTKSIEDNVMTTCAAIVENCVIVGHLKPKVVLIIEPKNLDIDAAAFKTDILSRVSQRLFAYERISGPSQIIIAEKGSLPRTVEKGNVRRKAAEEQHAVALAEIYSS